MICPPGKSMIFYKKETEKIELVARPGTHTPPAQIAVASVVTIVAVKLA